MDYVTNFAVAVYETFTPEPVSPLFKAGGLFEGYNEELIFITLGVVFLGIVDVCFVMPLIRTKARYFALHTVANAIIAAVAFPDVVRVFTDHPSNAYTGSYNSALPNAMAASIHLYHCIAFRLRAEDIFHHLLFVLTLCPLAVPFKQNAGASACMAGFFATGLPGGINYLMLVLKIHDLISKDFEKKCYTFINIVIRAPGLVIYVLMYWYAYRSENPPGAPLIIPLFAGALHYYNGNMYAAQAAESEAKYFFNKKHNIAPKASKKGDDADE